MRKRDEQNETQIWERSHDIKAAKTQYERRDRNKLFGSDILTTTEQREYSSCRLYT